MSPVLAHERVDPDGSEPAGGSPGVYFLHGIFGSGRNWRSVARRVADATGAAGLLVDLRLHGDSVGFMPPHTVAACADDVIELTEADGGSPRSVVGHSFGGKVALALGRRAPRAVRRLWIVDADPSAGRRRGEARRMLEALRRHPGPFEAREEAVRALSEAGFAPLVARWMATNLEEREEGLWWGLNFDGMQALLDDYARTDLWRVVEDPPARLEVDVVKAEESEVLDEEACRRIEEAGRRHGRTRLHRLEGGHWLNVANPEGLVNLLTEGLAR